MVFLDPLVLKQISIQTPTNTTNLDHFILDVDNTKSPTRFSNQTLTTLTFNIPTDPYQNDVFGFMSSIEVWVLTQWRPHTFVGVPLAFPHICGGAPKQFMFKNHIFLRLKGKIF